MSIAAGSPTATPVNCLTHAPTGPAAATASRGFFYSGLFGTYTYKWKTPLAYHGTCQQFTLTLTDGSAHSAHSAYFAF
ncbi:PxKF domain-containing protein [Kitasatospora purpeofusca]|uniref:PxKF domain-containing protein n=1 Tax=Kitasatospora purpeofusca TaxID=67352 RepID=UPI0036461474